MTAIEAARQRLEAYVIHTLRQAYDHNRPIAWFDSAFVREPLRRLEDEIVLAVRAHKEPF